MLPNSKYRPSGSFKFRINFGIPFPVARKFFIPICLACLRADVTIGATMPKAPVNEYRQFLVREDEIRPADQ